MFERPLAADIRAEQRVWAKPDSVEFFREHRQAPEDLYPSERFFLPEVLPSVTSCLDIGCAAGGFSRIMRSFNPGLAYTGIDVNPEFVEIARSTYLDCRFLLGDGINFATPSGSYDLVYSGGILHLNSRYADIIRAGYAQARRFLLFDLRLTYSRTVRGSLRLEFKAGPAEPSPLPYFALNVEEALGLLRSLQPKPRHIRARGYYHAPSPMATLGLSRVMMAFFLVEKGDGTSPCEVDLDIELPPPATMEMG